MMLKNWQKVEYHIFVVWISLVVLTLEMISPPYGQLRRMCGIGSSIVSAAFSTHTMTNYYYYYYSTTDLA